MNRAEDFLGLRHSAVTVENLPQSLRFYTEILGFSRFLDQDSDWAMVSHAGTTLSLVTRDYDKTDSGVKNERSSYPGIHHLGFVASSRDSVDRMYSYLKDHPTLATEFPTVRIHPPKLHRDRSYGFYFLDPDGNALEWIAIPSVPYFEPSQQTPLSDPNEMKFSKFGIILLAHGSSDPHWAKPVLSLRDSLRSDLPACGVEVAFMEFAKPDLDQALESLLNAPKTAGLETVLVFPHFISKGGHVSRDLPAILQNAQSRLKSPIQLKLCETLGEAPEVREAMRHRIAQYLQKLALGY